MNAKRRRQGRQRRRSGIGGELLFIMVLFLGCGIAIFTMFVNMITPLASTNDVELNRSLENPSYEPWAQNSATEQIGNHASLIGMVPTDIRNITDTGYLALINRRHAVSAELGSELVPVWPTVPVSQSEEMLLHPMALQAVADMFDAARSTGVGSFFVSSGFRGYDTQAILYNNGANGAYALPPGHSEHHTGLAVDILAVGISQAEMGSSWEGRWLAENSYRFGLILRYPQGATHITGIEFEPWHFRYVGKPHAYFMRQNNLLLEEYIELLQNNGKVTFERDGRTYYVFHQNPHNGLLYLPEALQYSVSGDNVGDFVITAWE